MLFTSAQLEEIRARIDLGELVASYGYNVRRAGSSLKCCCPFHNEKTPSFSINPATGFYHCFGCGVSGTAFTFVCREEGLTFPEAVRKLAEKTGVKLEEREDPDEGRRKRLYAVMAEAAQFYRRCLGKIAEARMAREYLKLRDLDGEAVDEYTIGYAPKGMAVMKKWADKHGFSLQDLADAGLIKMPERAGDEGYHRFGGRLMFTINDRQGRAVAFSGRQLIENKNSGKYVNSPETIIFKKSNVLFGFDKASGSIAKDPHREVIICEGQIDCIRLHLSGFKNAVASQGTAFTKEQALMLKRVADTALLCYDDDDAGHKATIRAAAMLMAHDIPVRVASLPDGDDPDSFLRTKGPEKFRRMIEERSESVVRFQVRTARAMEAHPDNLDSVKRVTAAVLGTIASCRNAVLRATLAAEAAKEMNIPVTALREELERTKSPLAFERTDGALDWEPAEDLEAAELAPAEGMDASLLNPPPAAEKSLMELLAINRDNAAIEEVLKNVLCGKFYAHDFTKRFVAAYLEHRLNDFEPALEAHEAKWFTAILMDAENINASSLPPEKQIQERARNICREYLERLKVETAESPAQYEYLMKAKQMANMSWPKFKEFAKGLKDEQG